MDSLGSFFLLLKNCRFKINDVLLVLGSNQIHFSLIDPSSTGKGEGWTSPQYRNTGGRGPPPNGGPRRWRSSPGFVFFCVRQSNAIQANGWLWRWAGWRFPTPRSNGRRMRLRIHCSNSQQWCLMVSYWRLPVNHVHNKGLVQVC